MSGLGERARVDVAPAGVMAVLLGLYILLLPVQLRMGGTFRFAPSDLFMAASVVALVGAGTLRFRAGAFSPWHLLLVAMFAQGLLVTAINELDVSRYSLLNKGIGMMVLVTGYCVITSVASSWQRIRWFLRVFIISVVLHTLAGMAAFAAFYGAGIRVPGMNRFPMRLSGMLIDPNAFGGLLVLALAVLLPTTFTRRPLFPRAVTILAGLILSSGILLTFSRSAWLALAVVLLVAAVYDARLAVVAAVLGVAGLGAVIAVTGTDYLATIIRLALRGRTAHARLEFMELGMEEFAARPILGTGLGYFLSHHGFIIHNTPVWVLAEFGIVGFLLFSAFLAWFLWAGLRTYRRAPASERPVMVGLILAFLAMVALSAGIEALYQRHWWLIMALIAAAHACVTASWHNGGVGGRRADEAPSAPSSA